MVSTSSLSTSTNSLSSLGYIPSLSDSPTPGEELKLRKLFVGGLPWSTTTDTLKKHFEQFGEIEEAAVIFDKETGKSKGFGFVTLKDRKGADEACKDPNPYIDGRKANVNLAFLGQKPRSSSFSGSNTNLAALGLRPGAITPTSPGLLGHHGHHIGMHGAALGGMHGNYMYPGQNLNQMTAAAALMLQQNLAIAALQQQHQQQQQLALAAALHHQQGHNQHPGGGGVPTAAMHASVAHSAASAMPQHAGGMQAGGMTPQQLLEIQAIYSAGMHSAAGSGGAMMQQHHHSLSANGSENHHLMIPGAQAGVPLTPATAAQLALLSQLTNASHNANGSQSP